MLQPLQRSPQLLDPEDFKRVYKLMRERDWLEEVSEAFLLLWNDCDEVEQRMLIERLVSKFRVIRDRELHQALGNIALWVQGQSALIPKDTRLVAVGDGPDADGSQMILQMMKNKFNAGWDETNFKNTIKAGARCMRDGRAFVLVDDFIGTGNTIKKKVSWFREKAEERGLNIEVYVVAVAAMNFSRPVLEKFVKGKYYVVEWLDKGISDDPVYKHNVEYYINIMQGIESRLKKKLNKNGRQIYLQSLGYKKSESLFSLYGCNVPNNVFPVFWWNYLENGSSRDTLFRRLGFWGA